MNQKTTALPVPGPTPSLPISQIRQIMDWFEAAIPNPDHVDIQTQIGVHLEEVAEMLQPLIEMADNEETRDQIEFFRNVVEHAAKRFKSHHKSFQIDFRWADREKILDSLCDQIVTSVGIAHMFGMDIEGALGAVAASNDSKFGESGKPIFNASHKIMTGPNYRSPELTRFT